MEDKHEERHTERHAETKKLRKMLGAFDAVLCLSGMPPVAQQDLEKLLESKRFLLKTLALFDSDAPQE